MISYFSAALHFRVRLFFVCITLNLKEIFTNARGQTRSFTYDAKGRITGYTCPEGAVSYTYDENDNILSVTDSHGTITRTYDKLNRVLSYTDTYGRTIGYAYDSVGNLVRITYPDNTFVSYEYDANHNLVKVIDWNGRWVVYTYDENNRVTSKINPDLSCTGIVYDDMQRVTSNVDYDRNGDVICGFEYIYDDLSRIVEEKILDKNVKFCYTYDELSRVTKRETKSLDNALLSEESFTYDAAGNITDAPSSSFAYDTNNKLTVFCGDNVTYDLDGNMLSCGSLSYEYDSANRLVTANGNLYTYNAEDVRIKDLYLNGETTYTYNTNCALSQLLWKTEGGVTTKYVYGVGLLYEETANNIKIYHFDNRGSTVALTDTNGNITDKFSYDTYGKQISHVGTSSIIFGYNGRDGVITEQNGLIYMRARYYSPDMKRFINADIVRGAITNAVTLNRYAYANANPITNVDPFGLNASRYDLPDDKCIALDDSGNVAYSKPSIIKKNVSSTSPEQATVRDGGGTASTQTTQPSPPKNNTTSYGYSEDENWDTLLGENDAIYVVDYGFVGAGHAYVLLKEDDGSWVRTDFNTPKRDDKNIIEMKKDAHIFTYDISASKIISSLSKEPQGINIAVTTQKIHWLFGIIPVVMTQTEIMTVYTSGVQYVPLKGDFSQSIDMANEYINSNYGGYDLVENNCAHYAQEILRFGTVENARVEEYLETSSTIIPKDLYEYLYIYSK